VADAVLAGGGQVIGVIPEHLQVQEKGHLGVTELHVVASMHERKNLMFERSDAFVILPGGFGTLDEAFEMLTWRQLRLHDKPILFLNIEGYWTPFGKLVDQFVAEGFASAQPPAVRDGRRGRRRHSGPASAAGADSSQCGPAILRPDPTRATRICDRDR
jgi:uncharacterized protein (TIGR00730 family)